MFPLAVGLPVMLVDHLDRNPEKQLLMHRGRVLDDRLTASYYNVKEGNFIDLIAVGGAPAKPYTPLKPKQPWLPQLTRSDSRKPTRTSTEGRSKSRKKTLHAPIMTQTCVEIPRT